jgi:hypothetical protein
MSTSILFEVTARPRLAGASLKFLAAILTVLSSLCEAGTILLANGDSEMFGQA